MRLHDRFRLTLSGSLLDFSSRENISPGFERVIRNILLGAEFHCHDLRSWGISLAAEPIFEHEGEEHDAMCNLYRLRRMVEETARIFDARVAADFEWPAFIYPRSTAPVIVSAEGERRLGPMRWGFPIEVQGKTKTLQKHVTNARNLDSPMWRPSVAKRRCLVPFTEFAEPKPGKDDEGIPNQHWFSIADQPVAAFAGIWRPTPDGPTFAFCTTEPNALVTPLHPKAMPVVLMAEDHARWLDGSEDEARALQAAYPSQLMAVA